jgi:hypothetical protein
MVEHAAGDHDGKILSDPAIWYPVTASLAGIDVWSDLPQERLKYLVFQRTAVIEVLKNKALMMAALGNAEGTQKASKEYLDMVLPISQEEEELTAMRKQRLLDYVATMEPIPLSAVKISRPMDHGVKVFERDKKGKEREIPLEDEHGNPQGINPAALGLRPPRRPSAPAAPAAVPKGPPKPPPPIQLPRQGQKPLKKAPEPAKAPVVVPGRGAKR